MRIVAFSSSGKFHMELPAEISGDIVHLRFSYQSNVILLSDKHKYVYIQGYS